MTAYACITLNLLLLRSSSSSSKTRIASYRRIVFAFLFSYRYVCARISRKGTHTRDTTKTHSYEFIREEYVRNQKSAKKGHVLRLLDDDENDENDDDVLVAFPSFSALLLVVVVVFVVVILHRQSGEIQKCCHRAFDFPKREKADVYAAIDEANGEK
jgi:hypothetical protein